MRRQSRPADPADGPGDARAQAETHYLRMSRLRAMSYDDLRALLSGGDAEAAPWIVSAARYGVAEAQVRLGQMYLDGVGVARDHTAALEWFLRAARKGSCEAMNMVGRCYENGWGADEALAAAATWYRSSADAGHDWGQYNYANMLFDGRGVDLDREQAVIWYRRAADQGHTRAMNLLARCHEEGWGTTRNPSLACEWYRRSAHGGYFRAQFNYATVSGVGRRSVPCRRRRQGFVRAQFNYATVLASTGRIGQAMGWFEKARGDAPRESLTAMTEALIRQGDARLSDLGRRWRAAASASAGAQTGTVLR
jgi:TPR repeat protein